eukprot:CAMPEP_0119126848 /NCGR_PEP_ID=MMETSP1310-20130426/5609_1 /TAXON_ID=464262 /ORGANISM="Genus nov. species nov., Strain RCC2339" /LENGTH=267 /DNA_ID=CAMNT_0007117039 /DNA_START=247 /DNA_END=1047 /DNA_ORIENTATION=+
MFFKFIPTSVTGVRTTFERVSGLLRPGLNFYIPFIQRVELVSNRLRQDVVRFDVKSKDNVFSTIGLAVQYRVKPEDSAKAYFSLEDPVAQIESYIENVVRAKVPQLTLDELFESQAYLCEQVSANLYEKMIEHGFTIENCLVTEIEPDADVKQAMNRINASERLREAAKNEADANYLKEVRQAESDKERKRLQGEGISQQRLAIITGYQDSMSRMSSKLDLSPKEVIAFVSRVQELDTMEHLGKSPNTKILFFERGQMDPLTDSIVK